MSAPHEARVAGDGVAVPLDALGELAHGGPRKLSPGPPRRWQLSAPDDNSGVCVRIPWLGHDDPEEDFIGPGAIYRRAPAVARASRLVGQWNTFEIEAHGPALRVRLNGVAVCALDDALGGRPRGYVGLQAHHPGSRVRFRRLRARRASEV
jgi:hypothetical protein